MSKRLFTSAGLTYTASAAGSSATTSAYMALLGGSTTQIIDVLEVEVIGMASASTLGALVLTRASTLATTPTALAAPHSDGGMNPNITALVAGSTVTPFVAATGQPTPSNTATDAHLNVGCNLFGGINRWNASPFQQWQQVGNAVTVGESVLWNSSSAGGVTGAANAHILYEPY
jgi:hypothetical protein